MNCKIKILHRHSHHVKTGSHKQRFEPSMALQEIQNTPSDGVKSIKGFQRNKDGDVTFEYQVGKLLGKGAFAQCFELRLKGKGFAGKFISKASCSKPSSKQKLITEIKNHRSLGKHPHVVLFVNYFENAETYFIILELCNQRTARSLLRRRKKLSEPEVRYYLKQIIDGLQYVHSQGIVHRDLKLENIFIKNMQLKLGDFGLSALIKDLADKKTICGTPNYLAPEVLKGQGHGYPMDIWALGIIAYSLIIGYTPFEGEKIETTYQRIKENRYEFPIDSEISQEAKNFITMILNPDPHARPTIEEILSHPFLSLYTPTVLPEFTLLRAPSEEELRNYEASLRSDSQKVARPKSQSSPNPIPKQQQQGPRQPPTPELKRKISDQIETRKIDRSPLKKQRLESKSELSSLYQLLNLTTSTNFNVELLVDPNGAIGQQVWVMKWIDYSLKYGLGYSLCNNTSGVVFNDNSKIVLTSTGQMDYFETIDGSNSTGRVEKLSIRIEEENLDNFVVADNFINKRVTLLKNFRNYLNNCKPSNGLEAVVAIPSTVPIYVRHWLRTEMAILFYLSNSTIQINFFDHSKVILSECQNSAADSKFDLVLTFIKDGQRKTAFLRQAIASDRHAHELLGVSLEDLLNRLRYLKDCIHLID
jgi:serine/threonine protein kinase